MELHEITFKPDSNYKYLPNFPTEDVSIPYSEFFEKYIIKNQACLLKGVSSEWESSEKWVTIDNAPNFSYLCDAYGDCSVTVHDCTQMYDYSSTKPIKWKLHEYINYWKDHISEGYPKDQPLYYLKDWHLKNHYPDDNFYGVPLHFASDWLNEYLVDTNRDDYRFVYMGVKGTWTPFHADVMTSYSWSSNICGQKRWVLFPPGEEQFLLDARRNLPHDIAHLDHDRKCFEVVQDAGDAIFVPSNWHHQVWNVSDTISINHNWINGCNLYNVWQNMKANLCDIKEEIKDCSTMDGFLDHCQVMLRASFSMNFEYFYDFLVYIASKRMNLLEHRIAVCLPGNRTLGHNHALFDLQAIHHTLSEFIQHEDLMQLSYFQNSEKQPHCFIQDVEKVIEIPNKAKR